MAYAARVSENKSAIFLMIRPVTVRTIACIIVLIKSSTIDLPRPIKITKIKSMPGCGSDKHNSAGLPPLNELAEVHRLAGTCLRFNCHHLSSWLIPILTIIAILETFHLSFFPFSRLPLSRLGHHLLWRGHQRCPQRNK